MLKRVYQMVLLGLLQLSIILGIVLLPVALLTRQVGLHIPVDRVLSTLTTAHKRIA